MKVLTPNPYIFISSHLLRRRDRLSIDAAGAGLAVAALLQPPGAGRGKNATYECGVESIGEAQVQFQSQYYLYCIIFLIFDVEAVFLVPFAVAFTGLPIGAFIALLVFCCCCSKDSFGPGAKVV